VQAANEITAAKSKVVRFLLIIEQNLSVERWAENTTFSLKGLI